jgi:hypothetical protein
MLLFRSEEHVKRWCRIWRMDRGGTLSLEELWQLAQAWYSSDRSEPEWQRYTVAEVGRSLRAVGLLGDFWYLS